MNQVAVREKEETSVRPIDQFRHSLSLMDNEFKAALPEHVSVDKFKRVVITAVQSDANLLAADRKTLFKSCVQCASDGLLPDGKEAALVIFNTKEGNNWVKKVQYMPMIKGLIKLVRNSGDISSFTAQVVYENDKFSFDLASEERPKHEIDLTKLRGNLLAAYAIANFKDGSFQFELMPREDIEKVKRCSKGITKDKMTGEDKGIWVTWEAEMWRKTVAKRLVKYLSLSSDIQRAVDADNALYDLDKINAPQKQLTLPTNLSEDWNTIEPVQEDADNADNAIESEDYSIADLSNDIASALFFSEIRDPLEKLINSPVWRNLTPQGQASVLSDIVAPIVLETDRDDVSIGTQSIAGFLALLWTLDADTLAKYLNGDFTEGKKDVSTELLPLIAIRKKELNSN